MIAPLATAGQPGFRKREGHTATNQPSEPSGQHSAAGYTQPWAASDRQNSIRLMLPDSLFHRRGKWAKAIDGREMPRGLPIASPDRRAAVSGLTADFQGHQISGPSDRWLSTNTGPRQATKNQKNWQDSLVFCEEENGAAWNVAVWVRSWRSSAIPRNQTTAGKPSLTSETSPPPEGNSNNSGGIFLSACPPVWKPSTAGMSGKHPWEQRRSGGAGQFVRCNWFGLVDPAESPWGSCRGDGHRADHLYCRCPQGHESQGSADPRITCGLSSFLPGPADSRG